jgi:hypothetical protein
MIPVVKNSSAIVHWLIQLQVTSSIAAIDMAGSSTMEIGLHQQAMLRTLLSEEIRYLYSGSLVPKHQILGFAGINQFDLRKFVDFLLFQV